MNPIGKAIALGLISATASALAVLAPAAASAEEGEIFTLGTLADIDSANPFVGYSGSAYEVFQMQYLTLTQYAADDFAIVPGLAESWEEAPDQLSWTYNIRPGMAWSDGTPITANDAAYTFNRILNGKQESVNYYAYTANITSVEAVDDLTFRINVDKPSPIMERLYVYILPEHIWSGIDKKEVATFKNEGTPESPIVGSGPYLMIERRPGQFTRFAANPEYFRGEPAVKEVVWRIFLNADALGQALKKGEVDAATDLTPTVWSNLKDAPGITAVASANTYFNHIAFNTGAALVDGTPIGDGNPAVRDARVRRALSLAIDREAMTERLLQGLGTAGSTVIPPMYADLHLTPASGVEYDPALAGQLLDEAGYPLGPDGVRVGSDGQPLTLRFFGRSDGDADSAKILEYVQAYFADVGVTLESSLVSTDVIITKYGEGKYDLYEWGWGVEPDPNYMLSAFTCANRSYEDEGAIYSTLSDSFYCNEEYDALWEEQSTETDSVRRAEIVRQMQQMLIDDMPYLVLYYPDQLSAYRSDRFTGFIPQPRENGAILFQYGTWTWDALAPVTAEAPASEGGSASAPASGEGSSASTPAATSGSSTLPYVIVGAVVIGLGVGVVLLQRRRRTSANLRE